MTSENAPDRSQIEASLVRRAWTDDQFRQRLLLSPQDVFEEELKDVDLGDVQFKVLEETRDTVYLVLPKRPEGARSDRELADTATRGAYRLKGELGLVDLNHATIQQTEEVLWGIDVEFANVIENNRPYRLRGDLNLTFSTITSQLLESVKNRFIVSTPALPPSPGRRQVRPQSRARADKVIDVNRASHEELRALPGLGTAFAEAIIDSRPYYSVDQLAGRSPLIGSKVLFHLRNHLTV